MTQAIFANLFDDKASMDVTLKVDKSEWFVYNIRLRYEILY